jgi:TonB family protein
MDTSKTAVSGKSDSVAGVKSNGVPRTNLTGSGEPRIGPLMVDSIYEPWYSSFAHQVGELFQPQAPLAPLPKYRPAMPGELDLGSTMELKSVHQPWYASLVAQIRSISEDKRRAPLKVTSKPVPVKGIWGLYDFKRRGVSVSAVFHVLVVATAFGLSGHNPDQIQITDSIDLVIPVDISPYLAQLQIHNQAPGESGGGGGGGQNSPLPPSKGRLPRFAMEQLTPPTPIIRNPDPELAVEPTVLVPPSVSVPQIDIATFGDPLAGVGPPSAGPGSGGGIGTGKGTGVGPGRGGGVGPGSGGGIGGGVFRVGGGVSAPRLTYKVEPEYSEEARKAKYQGTVVLAVEVWPDGVAHNIRVLRSLGLGLDEKAIEAVEKWKFVPGRKDGKPVRVAATIEVNFRLL